MRTTLSLDDDVLDIAKSIAHVEGRSLGAVVSELARRGLAPAPQPEREGRFPMFPVVAGMQPITDEMVRAALEEQ